MNTKYDPNQDMTVTDEYVLFWGGVFSNFHHITDGSNTSEHIFMQEKALCFNDIDSYKKMLLATSPGKVKRLGKKVVGFDEETWVEEREKAMMVALRYKLLQCPEFKQALIDSGDRVLVEASPYDRVWGIGFSTFTCLIHKKDWGLNLLGKCLMKVRDEL